MKERKNGTLIKRERETKKKTRKINRIKKERR